ncbi:MAG: ATP-binding cassette domain-containing protein [Planctomycetota bacterium]|nr:MAG: ATP-binding cassette domain-containing protein [Planctomycetota bacterium]
MARTQQPTNWLPNFRRAMGLLRPHLRPLIIGIVAALGVGVFYTVSISSVIPLLKTIFADHETLVDWIHRVETQRRLDVAIAPDLPDDPAGLLLDHVRPDSRSRDVLKNGDRIVAIDGRRMSAYELMYFFASHPDKNVPNVIVRSYDGDQRTVQLRLRRYHWWSTALRGVASVLPTGKDADSKLLTLALVMGAFVLVAILGGLCRLANEGLIAAAVQRAMHDLRTGLAGHVLRLPMHWHNTQPPGDTLGRFATDISKVEVGLTTLFGKVIREPLKATGVLAMTIMIDWKLLVVAVLGLPIGAIAMGALGRVVKRAQRRASQSWGRLLDHLGERLAGIRVVKAYATEGVENRRFEREDGNLTKAQVQIEVVDAATKPILETLAAMAVAGFVLYGGSRVFSHELEPHLFFAAVVCLGGIYEPMRKMGNVNNRLQAAEASSRRLFELMDLEPERDPPGARDLPAFSDAIEFHHVGFSYPSAPDKLVLRDIDLTVRKGEVVALVGPNGSGKTTLMSLLMRFYAPTEGRILIDGHDICDVTLASLRRQVGLVTQEAIVFSGTVAENIAYGVDEPIDEQRVREAARRAHMDDFVQTLVSQNNGRVARGYDAHITARSLSGGQRQRIALARAMLRDPPILILDEATSQVDSESEARIQEAFDDVTEGRTTFIIAHRFSTIARADKIVVLDDGRVVAVGEHEELIHSCPFYVSLCQTQFAQGV